MHSFAGKVAASALHGIDGKVLFIMDSLKVYSLTGTELKARRCAHGINQTQMGQLIECSRHAVSYWETQAGPMSHKRLRWGVPARMCKVLGIEVLPNYYTSTHARGDGVLDDALQAALDRECARQLDKAEASAAQYRQPCQAMTRKGQPCRMKSEAGRRRCQFHGGLSTGPKTPEGKDRIAEAQRRRWARHRAGGA